MSPTLSQELFNKNIKQLLDAIQICIEKELITPSLILIYSAIDIMSWLNSEHPKESVKARFTHWVDRYMLSAKPLKCTAIELYGARCGLVHTFTAESDLSQQGTIRQIIYASGASKASKLSAMITTAKLSNYVPLQVEELLEAVRRGLEAFKKELSGNPSKAAKVSAKGGKFFKTVSNKGIDDLLQWGKGVLGRHRSRHR